MSSAYDIVQAMVLSAFAIVLHRVCVEVFNTNGALYGIAVDGTANLHGAERAAFMAEFLVLWLPMLIFGFAWVYAFYKIYRRQAITAQTQVGP